MPEYVERFRQRWPEIGIEIRSASGEQRLRWLRDYEMDLVVGSVDVAPADVTFHPVRASQLVLVPAADHALAGRASAAPKMAGRILPAMANLLDADGAVSPARAAQRQRRPREAG